VRLFHAIESAKRRRAWRGGRSARILPAHYPVTASAMISVWLAARAANSPAKLFQQHFKGLSFNARQALAVKFER